MGDMSQPPTSDLRARIREILDDFVDNNLLPAEHSDRPEKMACRRIYGMMCGFFNRALDSADPIADYKQMQGLLEGHRDSLRPRLEALMPPNKDLSEKVIVRLDNLSKALGALVSLGKEEIIAMHEREKAKADEEAEAVGEPKKERPPPVEMVPITKVQQVKQVLKKEREKVRKLIEENNRLAMDLRNARMENDQLRRMGRR